MSALPLSSTQRALFKSQAHLIKPVVAIGTEGLTLAVMKEIDQNLMAHQLIKIRIFEDVKNTRDQIYKQICNELKAAPIQHIGKLFVIWRPNDTDHQNNNTALSENQRANKKRTHYKKPSHRNAISSSNRTSNALNTLPNGPARLVTIIKPTGNPLRRPKPKLVSVKGNERITIGGNIRKGKKRMTSVKRHLAP